jgi:hypothetical protein
MTSTGKNRIMIFGPKDDGTYVVARRGQMPIQASGLRLSLLASHNLCSRQIADVSRVAQALTPVRR